VVSAQDESATPDPVATLADSDFAEVFPTELGGLPWDDLTIAVGQENLDDQDEEEVAQFETLLDAVDRTIDDVTMVSATRISEDFTEFTYLVAFKVSGADADRVREELLLAFADDLEQPRQESGQVGGKDVVIVYDDTSSESPPFHLYASGDTVWYVIAGEPDLTEALERLP
jgi:hypothetical protein